MIIALAPICTPFVIAEQPVEAKCDCSMYALWAESYSDVGEFISAADDIIIGVVESQTVEMRHDLAFTRSFVRENATGNTYEIIQTGGIVNGDTKK